MLELDFNLPIIDFANFDFSMIGNAFTYGGSVLLIGMATIFAVLCLLWLCLVIFRIVFHDIPEKKAANKAASQTVESFVSESYYEPVNNDEEIVAVIAAAIAMAESENSDTKFRVVSFKRI